MIVHRPLGCQAHCGRPSLCWQLPTQAHMIRKPNQTCTGAFIVCGSFVGLGKGYLNNDKLQHNKSEGWVQPLQLTNTHTCNHLQVCRWLAARQAGLYLEPTAQADTGQHPLQHASARGIVADAHGILAARVLGASSAAHPGLLVACTHTPRTQHSVKLCFFVSGYCTHMHSHNFSLPPFPFPLRTFLANVAELGAAATAWSRCGSRGLAG